VESGGADRLPTAGAPTGAPAGSGTRRRSLLVAGVVGLVLVLDQLTKALAVWGLSDGPISVLGDTVELRLARNPGGAFGRFQGMTPLLALAAVVVTVILVRAVRRTTDPWFVAGLTLVLAGALGNLVDRLVRSPGFLRGHVVDFVSIGWWPVFNIADVAITTGAAILVVRSLLAPADG